jgi:hypothetical protein
MDGSNLWLKNVGVHNRALHVRQVFVVFESLEQRA